MADAPAGLAATEPPGRLVSGTRLGAYVIRDLLGAGGMGEVYRAHDARLRRDVAVKVLPAHVTGDAEARARFETEARAVAALSHPGIVTLFDIGQSDGVTFAVTELLEGETLRQRLAVGALPVRLAIDIGIQVAEALAAAHAKGIVHRDVKPPNIFLARDGRARVLDFGLARLKPSGDGDSASDASTASALTRPGTVLGTLGYMSPEQAQGRPVDARSDVFSLGATVFECLSGRRAFPGGSTAEVLSAVLRDDPGDLAALRREVPAGVAQLVARCLEKDREQRFQSARDLAVALRAVCASDAARAVGAAPAIRSRRGPALAAAAVVILAAALAGWTARRPAAAAAAGPAFTTVTPLTPPLGLAVAPALSPDGKWVAYIQVIDGRPDVWVRFLTGGDAVNLTRSAGLDVQGVDIIGGLDISPDGAQLVFNAVPTGGAVNALDAWTIPAPLGGTPRRLLARAHGVRWSPDGRRIAYVKAGGPLGDALAVADADGGNERMLVERSDGLHLHWPAWSSDGRHLYYIRTITTANREPSEIYRVPTGGGPPEPVVRTPRRALSPAPLTDGSGLVYAANPDTTSLGLFFQPSGGGAPLRLTIGAGEYSSPRAGARGDLLVATHVAAQTGLAALRGGSWARIGGRGTGDLDPGLSPDGTRLVFSSTRAGPRNLWLAAADGTQARPLTTGDALDERPAFSPDGRTIAFVSDRGGQRGIWLVASDGGPPRRLAAAEVLDQLSYARDGSAIFFCAPGDRVPSVYRVSVADGAITRGPAPTGGFGAAASPVSDVLAYVALDPPRQPRLALVGFDGRPLELPESPVLTQGVLAWSRDGRELAVYSVPGAARGGEAWRVTLEGAVAYTKLAPLPDGANIRGITFAADGSGVILGLQEATSQVVLLR